MQRKQIKSILETEQDIEKKTTKILNLHHSKMENQKTEEYNALKAEYENYKYLSELKIRLISVNVKEKFIDDVVLKISREKPLNEQISKIKEAYAEYFENDKDSPADEAKTLIHALEQIALQQLRRAMEQKAKLNAE